MELTLFTLVALAMVVAVAAALVMRLVRRYAAPRRPVNREHNSLLG